VQPVLRKSLRLKAKEEEEKKDSKEDDSILTDIETYSDSDPPEESGESSQGILNSIGGLFSRLSGAAANITKSTSSMVLEEMVYGVSHETEPTSFQDAISGPESKECIEAIQSEVSSLEENQTWRPCCLPLGRKAISIKWVFKKHTNAEGKVCRYKARLVCNWSAKEICKENALILLKLLLHLQSVDRSDV